MFDEFEIIALLGIAGVVIAVVATYFCFSLLRQSQWRNKKINDEIVATIRYEMKINLDRRKS